MSHTTKIVTAAALALLGCAHEHMTAQQPEQAAVGEARVTSSAVENRPSAMQGIHPSADIIAACKIHFDNEKAAPEFCFDQSTLTPPDRDVLGQIATCLTKGPLAGRDVELIGRADPRGEVEYNMTLGSARAGSVASYLESLGVGSSQITQTSRGKLDATGTDEATWQLDRRVDVLLK